MFIQYHWNAQEIFDIKKTNPISGMPTFSNLVFSKKTNKSEINGCGIYLIYYKQKLIYIGKFRGNESNAFGGSIFTSRWNRHMQTLTLRGNKISIKQNIINKQLNKTLLDNLSNCEPLVLEEDKGFVVSRNRLEFANLYWETFQQNNEAWLNDFEFSYVQFNPEKWQNYNTNQLRTIVSTAEDNIIKRIQPLVNGGVNFENALSILLRSSITPSYYIDIVKEEINKCLASTTVFQTPILTASVSQKINTTPKLINLVSDSNTPLPKDKLLSLFLEKLPSSQEVDFVLNLIQQLNNSNFNIQIHFTRTNDVDLRIRHFGNPQAINIFTMHWQSNKKVFKCMIRRVQPNLIISTGISDIKSVDKEKTEFKLDCQVAQSFNSLYEIIVNSIKAHS